MRCPRHKKEMIAVVSGILRTRTRYYCPKCGQDLYWKPEELIPRREELR